MAVKSVGVVGTEVGVAIVEVGVPTERCGSFEVGVVEVAVSS